MTFSVDKADATIFRKRGNIASYDNCSPGYRHQSYYRYLLSRRFDAGLPLNKFNREFMNIFAEYLNTLVQAYKINGGFLYRELS